MGRSRVWSKQAFLTFAALSAGVLGWSVAHAAPPAAASGKPRFKAGSVAAASAVALPPAEAGAWSASIVPSTIISLAAVGADVYAGTSGGGLLKSSDHGQHFSSAASPNARSLWARSEGEVYAGSANVISRSTDHGQTWQDATLAANFNLSALWGTGTSEVYGAGSMNAPLVYYSNDSGKTFEARKIGPKSGLLLAIGGSGPKDVVVGGSDVSTSKALLFRSTDQGKHWTKLPIPKSKTEYATSSINGICYTSSGKLFVATGESLFMSSDKGAHWKFAVSSNNAELLALVCHGSEVFVATRGHTFLYSSDDGAQWSPIDLLSALPDAPYGALQAVGLGSAGELYVGGEGTYQPITGAIYRRAAK